MHLSKPSLTLQDRFAPSRQEQIRNTTSRHSKLNQAYSLDKSYEEQPIRRNSIQPAQHQLFQQQGRQILKKESKTHESSDQERLSFKLPNSFPDISRNLTYERASNLNTQKSIELNNDSLGQFQQYHNYVMQSHDTPPKPRQSSFRKKSERTNPNILYQDQNIYTEEEQWIKRGETKQHNPKTQNTPLINSQTTAQIAKIIGKRFKYYLQAIRAAVRLNLLIRPKQEQWNLSLKQFIICRKQLKFNESKNQIKIKQWCQMIMTKAMSVIVSKYQFVQLNFIENPHMSPIQLDQATHDIQNIFKYVLSNLELFTTQKLLLIELGMQMYTDQFIDQRKSFSLFVSRRTKYLSNQNKILTPPERAMIFGETIILNYFLNGLIKLTENKKILDCEMNNIAFLLRCIISLIQYFFVKQFQNLPQNIIDSSIECTQRQLGKSQNVKMVLVEQKQVDKEDFIIGSYKNEQIAPILDNIRWKNQMAQLFENVLDNLCKYKCTNVP